MSWIFPELSGCYVPQAKVYAARATASTYLIQRYHCWKATAYLENRAWLRRLASEGQHPRAMIISCCDSRVHVTSIFGADSGEFFIHRNIANLVRPINPMAITMVRPLHSNTR